MSYPTDYGPKYTKEQRAPLRSDRPKKANNSKGFKDKKRSIKIHNTVTDETP